MKTILIVDDDAFITSAYRSRFQAEGYLVEVAPNGGVALSLLKTIQPDVVLLDLQMPGVTGVEVLKQIRAVPATRTTPVVVFSNAYLASLVEDAWKAGASRVVSKTSCTANQLVETVRSALAATRPASRPEVSVSGTPAPHKAPPARVPAMVKASPAPSDVDAAVEQLRQRFLATAPGIVETLRGQVQAFLRSRGEVEMREQLQLLCRTIHGLIGIAGIAGCVRVAQMSSALEALFQELLKRPAGINVSTLRTIVRVVDLLKKLCGEEGGPEIEPAVTPLVLVVDDDPISRRSVCVALAKVHLRALSLGDPWLALKVVAENRFDLAFLDVDMPEMNGFTLCTKMRALPNGQSTPVVFVTALTNFEELAKSSLLENDEVIAKPFPLIELAVKALTYL